MFQGRILAFDAAKPQQHLVLWDDGEHEWINVAQEHLTWHAGERGQNPGFGAGLPAGASSFPEQYAVRKNTVLVTALGHCLDTVFRLIPDLGRA